MLTSFSRRVFCQRIFLSPPPLSCLANHHPLGLTHLNSVGGVSGVQKVVFSLEPTALLGGSGGGSARGSPTAPQHCAPRCPVMLVVGDQAPHEDAVVSRESWVWVKEGGSQRAILPRGKLCLGVGRVTWGHKRLIPDKKEMGRGLRRKELRGLFWWSSG